MTQPDRPQFLGRATLAITGVLAGIAAWVLTDILPHTTGFRSLLGIAALVGGFFAGLLAAAGPLSLRRAALAAGIVSLPAAGLFYGASFRHADPETYVEQVFPFLALGLILSIGLPFAMARLRDGESWRDYPALFTHAWNIVVRYAAAWLFVGIFWALVFLSDTLLKIVGLTVIGDILDIDPVPFVLTGLVLGLALAVVHELSDYVSPFLLLRLLRLLLPPVAVVMLVFLVAIPVQGFGRLLGGLSIAGTMLAMAFAGATLVTSALDQTNGDAVHGRWMRLATMGLSLLIPLLAGLAVYSIWLRVAQYGWTPPRLAAMSAGGVVTAYGLAYAGIVLLRHHWMDRIRQANIWLALAVVALAALWLTPVINAERISANSQVARFAAGKTEVADLSLWEVGREWGKAGTAAIARLRALDHPDKAVLTARLDRLEAADNKYSFASMERENREAAAGDIGELLRMMPGNLAPTPAELAAIQKVAGRDNLIRACLRKTPAGNPACVAVRGQFTDTPGAEEIFVLLSTYSDQLRTETIVVTADTSHEIGHFRMQGRDGHADITLIDKILIGEFSIEPPRIKALNIGGVTLIPNR